MVTVDEADRHEPLIAFAPGASGALDVLEAAFDRAPHGVIVSGEDGTIHFVNSRASAIFGYPPEALIGQSLSRLLPAAVTDGDQWTEFWKKPHRAAMIAGRTIDGIRQDGVRVPLEIGLGVVDEGRTPLLVATIIDVTERLDLEARLTAATDAHPDVERLAAEMAVSLGAIDLDGIDDAIVSGLRRIGEALELDCAMLWRWGAHETNTRPLPPRVQPSSPAGEPQSVAYLPFAVVSLKAGESRCFVTVDDLPDSDRDELRRRGFRSGCVMRLAPTGDREPALTLVLGSKTPDRAWAPMVIERLRLIAGVMAQALARRTVHHRLQKAADEIRRLRDRLALENVEVRPEVKVLRTSRSGSESAAIQEVVAQIERVAPTPATVLLLGETGTGKEVMARAIHDLSPRRQRQMIRVSCGAIPTSLIESELFGREKGAYGAISRQIGRFEAANQSTLFLDEIGDLPLEVQVKLLRVLQERVIERLGSTQPVKVDVRIIAATNRNLEDAVRDKTFREDLFYRLNVFPIVVPPLRERVEDIPALVWSFIDEFSKSFGKRIDSISKESLRALQGYSWPGNVRELRNVIERAIIVATGPQIVVAPPRTGERPTPQTAMTLTEVEVEHIRAVLKGTGWRVRGAGGAAERLGVKPTTLESRMVRLGIARKEPVQRVYGVA